MACCDRTARLATASRGTKTLTLYISKFLFQIHNLDLKSFGFSPKVPQRHLHVRQYHSITITFYHMMYRLGSNFQVHELLNRHTKLVAAWLLFQVEPVSTLLLKGL